IPGAGWLMAPSGDSRTHAPDTQSVFDLRNMSEAQILEIISAPGLPDGARVKLHPLTRSMQPLASVLHPAQIKQREFINETIQRLTVRASKRLQLADEIRGFELIQDRGDVAAAGHFTRVDDFLACEPRLFTGQGPNHFQVTLMMLE